MVNRTTSQERRIAPRVGARLPLQLTETESRQVVTTESVDLSRSGISCRTSDFVAPLSKVALTIILPPFGSLSRSPRSLRAEGVVVRCAPVPGHEPSGDPPAEFELACCFTSLESDARNLLDAFVAWRLLRSVRADEDRSSRLRSGAHDRAGAPSRSPAHARSGAGRPRPGGRARPAGGPARGGRPGGRRFGPGERAPRGHEGRSSEGGRRGPRSPGGSSSSRAHPRPPDRRGPRPSRGPHRERSRSPHTGGAHPGGPSRHAPGLPGRSSAEHLLPEASPDVSTGSAPASSSLPARQDSHDKEKRWGRKPVRSPRGPQDHDEPGGSGGRH